MTNMTRLRKSGGSLIATIPKELVDRLQLEEDDYVQINVKKDRRSGFGAFPELEEFDKKKRKFSQYD